MHVLLWLTVQVVLGVVIPAADPPHDQVRVLPATLSALDSAAAKVDEFAVVVQRASEADVRAAFCQGRACLSAAETTLALDDAKSLGVACGPTDAMCWQRFLALSALHGVLVVSKTTDGSHALLITVGAPTRSIDDTAAQTERNLVLRALGESNGDGPAPQAVASPPSKETADAIVHLSRSVKSAESPDTIAPVVVAPASALNVAPLAVVAAGTVVCVGSAVAAELVSLSLLDSLNKAKDGTASLDNYALRNGIFIGLVGVSVLGALTVASAVVWWATQ